MPHHQPSKFIDSTILQPAAIAAELHTHVYGAQIAMRLVQDAGLVFCIDFQSDNTRPRSHQKLMLSLGVFDWASSVEHF